MQCSKWILLEAKLTIPNLSNRGIHCHWVKDEFILSIMAKLEIEKCFHLAIKKCVCHPKWEISYPSGTIQQFLQGYTGSAHHCRGCTQNFPCGYFFGYSFLEGAKMAKIYWFQMTIKFSHFKFCYNRTNFLRKEERGIWWNFWAKWILP